MRTLLLSALWSLPALANVALVLLLLITVYGIVGTGLFGMVKQEGAIELSDRTNFSTWWLSVQTLFRCGTLCIRHQASMLVRATVRQHAPWCSALRKRFMRTSRIRDDASCDLGEQPMRAWLLTWAYTHPILTRSPNGWLVFPVQAND